MPDIRVALGEREFRQLCRGEVAQLKAAEGTLVYLILSDIGFDRMMLAVMEAQTRAS